MHVEVADNVTNSTIDEDPARAQTYYLLYEITTAILFLFGICLDTCIIYTIYRYKKLHTAPNMFIANGAMAHFCVLIIIPCDVRLRQMAGEIGLPLEVPNFLFGLVFNLRNVEVVFVFALAIDWCLLFYFPGASKKFRRYSKWTIWTIWIGAIVVDCVGSVLLMNNIHYHFPVFFWYLAHTVLFVFIFVLQFVRAVQTCRGKSSPNPTLMLTLATIMTVCWIPFWTTLIEGRLPLLTELCLLSTSIVTFITLYRCDQEFHECLNKTLKCSGYVDNPKEIENISGNVNTDVSQTQDHQNGQSVHL